ncbi:MAG: hypothetical protein Q8N53_17820 [Longimicrobiales bacterium]|nr:hypothetical protein [Longimicrobiales bacterium]
MRALRRFLASLALALLATVDPCSAQDVGVLAVRATSGNAELPHPEGYGAFAQLHLSSWGVRLTWLRYSDETDKRGVVCEVYSPRIGCRAEEVATSARMSGLRLTVLRTLSLGGALEVGAGGGVSFNSLGATSLGDSGKRADLHMPNTGQIGYLGSGSIAVAPVPRLPVRLVGGVSRHWVRFKGCVDATDPTSGYAPFCGWERFTEVQVGVSVTLPRQ